MSPRRDRPPIGTSQHANGQRASGGTSARPSGSAPVRRDAAGRTVPDFTRPALAPGLLAAVVLLACVAFVDSSAFVFVRWGITVLALIVLVFAVRGRTWWAVVLTAAVAVCWNPLVPVPLPGQLWAGLQLVAAALFIVIGISVKVRRTAE